MTRVQIGNALAGDTTRSLPPVNWFQVNREPIVAYGIGWFDLVGVAGVAFYITSYACLQLKLIGSKGYAFSMANLTAAALILISLAHDFNLASAMIQISWIIISTLGLLVRWRARIQ